MDGNTVVLEMSKRLVGRSVATLVNLGTVQIKGLKALVWWIHDHQVHNQLIIAAEFGQVSKRAEVDMKWIEKDKGKYIRKGELSR